MCDMFLGSGANVRLTVHTTVSPLSVPSSGLQSNAHVSCGEVGEQGELCWAAMVAASLPPAHSVWYGRSLMSIEASCHMMNHVISGR